MTGMRTASFARRRCSRYSNGTQREGVGAGKVAGGLGERFPVAVEVDVLRHLLPRDLLFEERSQDDGRGAGVFEALDAVEVVGQR